MLTMALPKGKSLEERTVALLLEARISVRRASPSSHSVAFGGYSALASGTLLKPSRIPLLVADGDFDIGITGYDAVQESDADVEVCAELPYGRATDTHTQGILFVHEDDPISDVAAIPPGSRILSEYPELTRRFFVGRQAVEIIASPGSAEAEVPRRYRFGMALSETGRSLRENALRVLAIIFTSHTVLIANKQALARDEKREAVRALCLLLRGAFLARGRILLSMNAPRDVLSKVLARLPSLNSPTVTPLVDERYCAVSAVVPEADVNGLVIELAQLGVRGIIAMPISSIVESW